MKLINPLNNKVTIKDKPYLAVLWECYWLMSRDVSPLWMEPLV